MGSHDRVEREICTKKGKGISTVKGGKERGAEVHTRATEERIYLALKVAPKSASVFCKKERWEKANGTEL